MYARSCSWSTRARARSASSWLKAVNGRRPPAAAATAETSSAPPAAAAAGVLGLRFWSSLGFSPPSPAAAAAAVALEEASIGRKVGEGSEWEEEVDGVLPDGDGEDEDEEVGDADGAEVDPAAYVDDEAYARALQDAEEREVAQRLMALAGITDLGEEMDHDDVEDGEDGDSAQDAWEDVDPDEYSYEELVALGEVVGTESRGVSADTLASLPSVTYQAQDKQDSNMEQCVICRVEFEEGESLIALPCKHSYHSECINQWLQLNKVCPMCSAEVPTSESNQA